MSIQLRAAGAYVNGTGNITPVIDGATVTGDMMLCFVGTKPYSGTNTMPAGWVSLGSFTDGTVAAGTDVGSMSTEVFYKIHDGSEANPLVTNTTNSVSGAVINSYYKDTGYGWDTPVAVGGGDAGTDTDWNITAGSNPGITVGDLLAMCASFRSESAVPTTARTIAAASATIDSVTMAPATDLTTTAGGDMGMTVGHALCTAGTATAAPTLAVTLAAGHSGSGAIVRLRQTVLPVLYPEWSTNASLPSVVALTGVVAGTRLVVAITCSDDTDVLAGDATITDNTAGGPLSWSKVADAQSNDAAGAQIFTAVFAAGGNITVTGTWSVFGQRMTVFKVQGQESTPGGASNTGLNQTNPSVSLTTGRNNSLVICCTSDWNATDGSSRVYRNGETEVHYFQSGSFYAAYHYFKIVPTAGTESFGLTAPSMNAMANTAVYEVRLPAGGANSMTLGTGAFAMTGQAVDPKKASIISAGVGSFAFTGVSLALSLTRTLSLAPGAFSLSGQGMALIKALKLSLETGAFTMTGNDLNFGIQGTLQLGTGTFSLTGQDLTFARALRMPLEPGTFALTGQDVTMRKSSSVTWGKGTFTLTGQNINFLRALRLVMGTGAFTLTGQNITLTPGAANIHYVTKTGNDTTGDGTIGNPWLTVRKACTTVTTAGHIIHIAAGTYLETASTINLSVGVSLIGDGDTSILQSSLTATFTEFLALRSASVTNGNQSISYLKFDGQYVSEANAGTDWGIVVQRRNNVEIHHCTITGFYDRGIMFGASTEWVETEPGTHCTGNSFHHNTVSNCAAYNAPSGVYGRGCLCIGGQDGMLVYENDISQTQRALGYNGWPIKYHMGGWNRNVKIYDNVITKIAFHGTYPGDGGWDFAVELWETDTGCEIYNNEIIGGAIDIDRTHNNLSGAYSIWIHHNNIYNVVTNPNTEVGIILENYGGENSDVIVEFNNVWNKAKAIEFSCRNGGSVNNTRINNNLFYGIGRVTDGNDGFAILFGSDPPTGGTITNVYIRNNTFVAYPTKAPWYGIKNNSALPFDNIYIQNNIIQGFIANGLQMQSGTNVNHIWAQNNNLYQNGNSNDPVTPLGTNQVVSGNLKVNPLYVGGGDYTLSSSSTLIDAGVDVGLPYNGSAPDIGYAEFLSGAYTLALGKGTFTLTGRTMGLAAAKRMPIDVGAFTLTGRALTLSIVKYLLLNGASFTLQGQALGVVASRILALSKGTFTLIGNDIYFAGLHINLDGGSFALTGGDMNFIVSRNMQLSPGAFSLQGQGLTLEAERKLDLASGSFALIGQPVILTAGGLRITLDPGSFSMVGRDVGLVVSARVLHIEGGSFALTGKNVLLVYSAGGGVNVWDGVQWIPGVMRAWDGTQWVRAGKFWDGVAWVNF